MWLSNQLVVPSPTVIHEIIQLLLSSTTKKTRLDPILKLLFIDHKCFCTLATIVELTAADYLIENAIAMIASYGDEIVSVEIPPSVELEIAFTEPGMQGDRVSGARKPATLQTGKVIQVPLFVNIGDRVKVDTRTAEYVTRV